MCIIQSGQVCAFFRRKASLRAYKNGPRPRQSWDIRHGARAGFIAKEDLTVLIPSVQKRSEPHHVFDLWHMGRAALLGGFYCMRLKPVALDPAGVREGGLDRLDTRNAELHGLFDDEVGPRLLDRRKQQPDIWWVDLRTRPVQHTQQAVAFARRVDLCQPLARPPIEQEHMRARTQPHHPKKIVRLRAI